METELTSALHEGDSETLNVYSADIGAGLLGWAYYTEDDCMDMFTAGQAARMSDGWLEYRAGGNG